MSSFIALNVNKYNFIFSTSKTVTSLILLKKKKGKKSEEDRWEETVLLVMVADTFADTSWGF